MQHWVSLCRRDIIGVRSVEMNRWCILKENIEELFGLVFSQKLTDMRCRTVKHVLYLA